MNERENFLRMLNGGTGGWIPYQPRVYALTGMNAIVNECGCKKTNGYDIFGVKWLIQDENMEGSSTPDESEILMPDIAKWSTNYISPDLEKVDWKKISEKQVQNVDRTKKIVAYASPNGVFQRLMAFMGFENMLCALYTDPLICEEVFEAITDYKTQEVKYVAKYIKPDVMIMFDDVAHSNGLFISPDIYRKHIKPWHKRYFSEMLEHNIIPAQHCCGKCEILAEDFIDNGAAIWDNSEPYNDLVSIQKKYGNRLILTGGMNTTASYITMAPGPDRDNAIREEVKHCMRTYGVEGHYMFSVNGLRYTLSPREVEIVIDEYERNNRIL